jgi:hypothetical protein
MRCLIYQTEERVCEGSPEIPKKRQGEQQTKKETEIHSTVEDVDTLRRERGNTLPIPLSMPSVVDDLC